MSRSSTGMLPKATAIVPTSSVSAANSRGGPISSIWRRGAARMRRHSRSSISARADCTIRERSTADKKRDTGRTMQRVAKIQMRRLRAAGPAERAVLITTMNPAFAIPAMTPVTIEKKIRTFENPVPLEDRTRIRTSLIKSTMALSLLRLQGHGWMDPGGTAGRDQAGREPDEDEQGRGQRKSQQIPWRHAEDRADQPCHAERHEEPDRQADEELAEGLPQDEAQDIAALSAQRLAHPELRDTPAHRERGDPVEAHHGQHQGQHSKNRKHRADYVEEELVLGDHLFHGLLKIDGEVPVEHRELRPQSGSRGRGVARRPHGDAHEPSRVLGHGQVDRRGIL